MPYEPDSLASLSWAVGGVVILLWAGLWALRRARPSSRGASLEDCRIMRSLALGPRERLLVVAVGNKHLVIGVHSAAISLLCELDEPLSQTPTVGFGEAVRRAREKWRAQ